MPQARYRWKLVRGDVFRRPALAQLFAVLLGSGVQITCMAGVRGAEKGPDLMADEIGKRFLNALFCYRCFAMTCMIFSTKFRPLLLGPLTPNSVIKIYT